MLNTVVFKGLHFPMDNTQLYCVTVIKSTSGDTYLADDYVTSEKILGIFGVTHCVTDNQTIDASLAKVNNRQSHSRTMRASKIVQRSINQKDMSFDPNRWRFFWYH